MHTFRKVPETSSVNLMWPFWKYGRKHLLRLKYHCLYNNEVSAKWTGAIIVVDGMLNLLKFATAPDILPEPIISLL